MWPVLCIPLPFVMIGGYFLYAGIMGLIQSARNKAWPKTPVVITKTEISQTPFPNESYEAVIHYEYDVAETVYQGVSSVTCESGGDAQRVLNRYTSLETVSAAYNPANPKESVLEGTTFGPLLAAGTFVFMGAGFLTIGLPALLITIFMVLV